MAGAVQFSLTGSCLFLSPREETLELRQDMVFNAAWTKKFLAELELFWMLPV
jgi:hypothetical protein